MAVLQQLIAAHDLMRAAYAVRAILLVVASKAAHSGDMRKPLPMRRRVGGMPGMLMAALLLVARLIAPLTAMPAPASAADTFALVALQTICHAEAPDDRTDHGHPQAPAQHPCLLCPACHLISHAAVPAPDGPAVRPPAPTLIGLAAPLPPATGPPDRPRTVAQPTGPPTLSV